MVPGALSLGIKRPDCEANHSPPSSVEVKNAWGSTPKYVFTALCSVKHKTTSPNPAFFTIRVSKSQEIVVDTPHFFLYKLTFTDSVAVVRCSAPSYWCKLNPVYVIVFSCNIYTWEVPVTMSAPWFLYNTPADELSLLDFVWPRTYNCTDW